jgi:diadenylate cyclase
MTELLRSIFEQVHPSTVVDIGITALLIYWLFSLIRGTRAVRLVIGVSVLIIVYFLAVAFNLILLTRILQGGAVVGLFALVVVFQPELRRALERIGRVGSFSWLLSPADSRVAEHVADEVAGAAGSLSGEGHGALIVIERQTGLEEVAETGVMIHGDVSTDLLRTIFSPRSALHDGAVIIRGDTILAAGALLPLAEMTIHTERFGTRHRAALGIAEQTDALVVVVSEENNQISLVERSRIVRNLNQPQLAAALRQRLDPAGGRRGALGWRPTGTGTGGRAPHLGDLGRFVGRPPSPPPPAAGPTDDDPTATAAAQAPR